MTMITPGRVGDMIEVRVTLQLLFVLRAILELDRETYGLEISDRAGLQRGVVYPVLARLVAAGCLTARWEDGDPHGRPPRKYYTLVPEKRAEVVELLTERGVDLPEVAW